jgi:hypothetical protein
VVEEGHGIPGCQLRTQMRAQRVAANGSQIVIEIAETGGEVDGVDPGPNGPMRQLVCGGQACRIGIDGNVKAAKIGGQL